MEHRFLSNVRFLESIRDGSCLSKFPSNKRITNVKGHPPSICPGQDKQLCHAASWDIVLEVPAGSAIESFLDEILDARAKFCYQIPALTSWKNPCVIAVPRTLPEISRNQLDIDMICICLRI